MNLSKVFLKTRDSSKWAYNIMSLLVHYININPTYLTLPLELQRIRHIGPTWNIYTLNNYYIVP